MRVVQTGCKTSNPPLHAGNHGVIAPEVASSISWPEESSCWAESPPTVSDPVNHNHFVPDSSVIPKPVEPNVSSQYGNVDGCYLASSTLAPGPEVLSAFSSEQPPNSFSEWAEQDPSSTIPSLEETEESHVHPDFEHIMKVDENEVPGFNLGHISHFPVEHQQFGVENLQYSVDHVEHQQFPVEHQEADSWQYHGEEGYQAENAADYNVQNGFVSFHEASAVEVLSDNFYENQPVPHSLQPSLSLPPDSAGGDAYYDDSQSYRSSDEQLADRDAIDQISSRRCRTSQPTTRTSHYAPMPAHPSGSNGASSSSVSAAPPFPADMEMYSEPALMAKTTLELNVELMRLGGPDRSRAKQAKRLMVLAIWRQLGIDAVPSGGIERRASEGPRLAERHSEPSRLAEIQQDQIRRSEAAERRAEQKRAKEERREKRQKKEKKPKEKKEKKSKKAKKEKKVKPEKKGRAVARQPGGQGQELNQGQPQAPVVPVRMDVDPNADPSDIPWIEIYGIRYHKGDFAYLLGSLEVRDSTSDWLGYIKKIYEADDNIYYCEIRWLTSPRWEKPLESVIDSEHIHERELFLTDDVVPNPCASLNGKAHVLFGARDQFEHWPARLDPLCRNDAYFVHRGYDYASRGIRVLTYLNEKVGKLPKRPPPPKKGPNSSSAHPTPTKASAKAATVGQKRKRRSSQDSSPAPTTAATRVAASESGSESESESESESSDSDPDSESGSEPGSASESESGEGEDDGEGEEGVIHDGTENADLGISLDDVLMVIETLGEGRFLTTEELGRLTTQAKKKNTRLFATVREFRNEPSKLPGRLRMVLQDSEVA